MLAKLAIKPPHPKQSKFIYSTAKFPCMGGGYGNGKTQGGCIRAFIFSMMYPNNCGVIGRAAYPELEATTKADFIELCPEGTIAHMSDKKNRLTFKNGSIVYFRHLDAPGDRAMRELKSLNLGWFYIDQAEEVTEEMFLLLMGRLRRKHCRRRSGWITDNPDGHNWVWKYWCDPLRAKKKIVKHPEDYELIEASPWDNIYLPRNYIQMLLDNYPDEWIKRYVYGNRDTASGLVYDDWNDAQNTVEPFEIPEGWEKLRVIDFGAVNPTCCLWLAIDPDGVMYVYDEYYVANEPAVAVHAYGIKSHYYDAKGDFVDIETLGDPSMKARTREHGGKHYSLIDEFADNGIYIGLANPDVRAGIVAVQGMLKAGLLKVFKHCEYTRAEFGGYRWKQLKVSQLVTKDHPEKPQKKNDHAMDCIRYGVMERIEMATPTPEAAAPTPFDRAMATLERKKRGQYDAELGEFL